MLRAVLFDLDNTLVDRDRAFRECLDAAIAHPDAREELRQLDDHGHGDRAALIAAWTRHSGQPMDQGQLGLRIAGNIRPDADLIEGLRMVAKRLKTGVITNGSGEIQQRKFQAAGLDQVVPGSHLWISGELGVAKPDPAIFHLACRSLGVAPSEALFIGDREEIDRAGAIAAGLRARLTLGVLNARRLAALLAEEQALPRVCACEGP